MQNNVYSHQLGAIALTVISEGIFRGVTTERYSGVDESELKSLVETDEAGCFRMGMNIVHLTVDNRSILLDTGIGESHPLRTALEARYPFTYAASLVSSLAAMGVETGEITDVLFSHTDGDHIMGATVERDGKRVPTFPNARHFLMRADWTDNPERDDPDSALSVHLKVLHDHGLLELIEGEYEVAPGIRMVPSPGETPGHANVRIESMGEVAFYVGDLFHHPAEVACLDWMWPRRDNVRMLASRHALVDEALATDAVVIAAHIEFPGIGKLRRADSLEWVYLD